jgi:ethanolamine utilization protein EutA
VDKTLISVGLDVGTTTTQLVVSQLLIENKASVYSVPEMEISERKIIYQSPIRFTPLLGENLVDGEKIRNFVQEQYAAAGIQRDQVDTGAIIITGETSRKENAHAVVSALSDYSGDFVVATAGPHLESILAAKGAAADIYSKQNGTTVLHMDIGGGTTNLALITDGKITTTGCLNIGGRLLKFDENGYISYCSPVLHGFSGFKIGTKPTENQLQQLCHTLVNVLEMAAGKRPADAMLQDFSTVEAGNPWLPPAKVDAVSFSGGVAACIEQEHPPLAFGDIGPLLGRAIFDSQLYRMPHWIGKDAIRATVIGAGSHATQLSGSTIYHQNISFPLTNLPVVSSLEALSTLDSPGILALSAPREIHYQELASMANEIVKAWPQQPILLATQSDMAKALGQAISLRVPTGSSILCIDRVRFGEECFLDVGAPMGSAIPVVVKTLILNGQRRQL